MIQAAIFDMDGLLIDSEPFWRQAEIEGFAEVGITLTEEDCKETMGYRLNEVVDLWYERFPWQGPSKQQVESRILELVIQCIQADGQALPGVMKTLDLCQNKGLKMAIASSSPMVLINAVVDKLAIHSYFDVIHSAQFEALGKPHPAVFISTAEKLGIAAKDCLVFEDSFHGVVAGLAAKMKVIAIPDAAGQKELKFHAASLLLTSLEAFTEKILRA